MKQNSMWHLFLQFVHTKRMYILLLAFVSTVLCFWPGIMMHDSNSQYQQALNGIYTDHHPPLMAFLWHYLDKIYPGSGLMFLLPLLMVYSSVLILLKVSDKLHLPTPALGSLLLVVLPIYPQILIYLIVVIKDVHFAASFLFCSSLLAYYTVLQKRPSLFMLHVLFTVLVYGAAVKYQGQYAVIILSFWLGFLHAKRKSVILKLLIGFLVYLLVVASIHLINHALVMYNNKQYSWEYVKLYDLAAISIKVDKNLIPIDNTTKSYSLVKLKQRFRYPAVDPLIFMHDPLLKISTQDAAMQKLRHVWWEAITTYPGAYLRHRINNLQYVLVASPGFSKSVQDIPVRIENDLQNRSSLYKIVDFALATVFFIFMSHLPVVVLGIIYCYLGLRKIKSKHAAQVLLPINATAILMVLILFPCSMAGTPRYTFMSILLIHATHIFAYSCLAKSKSVH